MKTLLLLLLGALLCPALARAQALTPEQKRATEKHFGRALKLTADRDYEGAIAAFGHAYELSREPEALLNQGLLHAKLDRPVQALEALDQVLRAPGDLPPEKLEKVRQVRATQAATIGHLEVATNAPARLEIDGLDVGRTPLERPVALKAGRHFLGVVATGFAPLRRTVDVKAGKVERLSLDLVSMTGRLANLRVSSPLPGVAVALDGHFVGHTPLASALAVPPGRHEVSFQRPGYVPVTRPVVLTDGASESLEVALVVAGDDPASTASQLQLAISEPGASVALDGAIRRIPPAGLPLPLGPHRLAIEHEGFLPYQREISLPTPGAHAFQITLEPTEMTRYLHQKKATTQRLRAWAVVGGGALIAGGGTVLLVRAGQEDRSAQRDFDAVAESLKVNGECYTGGARPGQEIDQAGCQMRINRANDRVDNARTQSWIARGTFALGLGVLATGAVLRLLAEDPDKYEARDLQLLGFTNGVGLGGRF